MLNPLSYLSSMDLNIPTNESIVQELSTLVRKEVEFYNGLEQLASSYEAAASSIRGYLANNQHQA